jgi:cellobiose phosphorylase
MWYTVSEFILGIKPDYDGIRIDPCLPETAGDYNVQRKFREAEYDITIHPNGQQKGVKQVVVDGHPIDGNVIPYAPGKHMVEVTM